MDEDMGVMKVNPETTAVAAHFRLKLQLEGTRMRIDKSAGMLLDILLWVTWVFWTVPIYHNYIGLFSICCYFFICNNRRRCTLCCRIRCAQRGVSMECRSPG